MTDAKRILGIQPGSLLTGFGVLEFQADTPAYVTSGSVKSVGGGFAERVRRMFETIGELGGESRAGVVAIESVFMHKNAGSALKLGHARAAALCATFDHGVEVFEYAPREIKLAVVGTGAATKEQVQHMIVSILQLDGTPAPDAADALAAALCHGNQRRMHAQLGTGKRIAELR